MGVVLNNKTKIHKQTSGNFPQRIEIELASACNLQCTYCPRKHLDKLNGFIDKILFERLIDEISKYPQTTLSLHRRGESLLHPQFVELCNYLKGKFKEVQIATNATLLDPAKAKAIIEAVDFISFSIDAPGVFNKTRIPANYSEVSENIFRFLNLNKGGIKTQVSMVKAADTPEEDIETFKEIWKGKVDRIRIYQEHSRDGKFGSLTKSRGKRLACVMPFYEMLIYCDGRVGRCNHDWDGIPMGNVNQEAIKDIWKSAVYNDLRRQHRDLSIADQVCKSCNSWYSTVGIQGTGETLE